MSYVCQYGLYSTVSFISFVNSLKLQFYLNLCDYEVIKYEVIKYAIHCMNDFKFVWT